VTDHPHIEMFTRAYAAARTRFVADGCRSSALDAVGGRTYHSDTLVGAATGSPLVRP
jgi:hypothetical protein